MTSKTIEGYELPVSALAAAAICMAEQDVRYYLNGVYLDFPMGRIVSTDGHRQFIGAIAPADCEPVIIERDQVTQAVKAAKKLRYGNSVRVTVTLDPEDSNVRRVEFDHLLTGSVFRNKAIDGKFPPYERVVPRTVSGEAGNYNPQYLVDANKALALYAGKDPSKSFARVSQNGPDKACLITSSATALCIVMPMRTDDGELDLSWLAARPQGSE